MRSVKILASVGPASREPTMLDALLAAGVDGLRAGLRRCCMSTTALPTEATARPPSTTVLPHRAAPPPRSTITLPPRATSPPRSTIVLPRLRRASDRVSSTPRTRAPRPWTSARLQAYV